MNSGKSESEYLWELGVSMMLAQREAYLAGVRTGIDSQRFAARPDSDPERTEMVIHRIIEEKP